MKVGDKLFCINDLYIEGGKPKDTIFCYNGMQT